MAKRNYSQLFAICKRHGFDYREKVAEFTDGQHDSLTKLTDGEYREFMLRMQRLNEPVRQSTQFEVKPGDKQRKKMLSLASQMRLGETTEELKIAINNWCLKQKFKKEWMKHNEAELNLLVAIYEKVYTDYLKALNK